MTWRGVVKRGTYGSRVSRQRGRGVAGVAAAAPGRSRSSSYSRRGGCRENCPCTQSPIIPVYRLCESPHVFMIINTMRF